MRHLAKRAEQRAEATAEEAATDLQSILQDSLPPSIAVSRSDAQVIVSGRHLHGRLAHHEDLRDIAFLMRAAR